MWVGSLLVVIIRIDDDGANRNWQKLKWKTIHKECRMCH